VKSVRETDARTFVDKPHTVERIDPTKLLRTAAPGREQRPGVLIIFGIESIFY